MGTGGQTQKQNPFAVLRIIFKLIHLLNCSFRSVINVIAFALHLVSVQRCLKPFINVSHGFWKQHKLQTGYIYPASE